MTDLRARLRSLDDIPVQDFWAEVESRAIARPAPRASGPSVLLIAAALVLAVVLGGAVLVGTGILPIPNPLENVTPSSAPASAKPEPNTSEAWVATDGPLGDYREGHTLTLLAGGRVLLVGDGLGGGTPQLFDPRTGRWVETAESSRRARLGHAAALLPDGRVLVTGGQDGNAWTSFASAEIFDPSTGTWSATSPMLEPRAGHTASLLPDGRVLVAGGGTMVSELNDDGDFISGSVLELSTAEIYDAVTGTWTAAGEMVEARNGHTATLLDDGTVLAAGGFIGRSNRAETYDPATDTWTATASMADAREGGHTASLLPSGSVLVAGGGYPLKRTVEIYDPQSRTWTMTTSMNEGRSGFTATTLPDGRVLVTGTGDGGYSGSPTAELFDPASAQWTLIADMQAPRGWHEAIGLGDGRVLVVGGYGVNSPPGPADVSDPTAEIYNPDAD